ncbi:MAG: phosphatase PAP2 family protein [Anaerolineaceae bacterium]|nr:phosphatase PAP2 family protein [Anaerolineaceae bacterium]
MNNQIKRKPGLRLSKNFFARLLLFWGEYHRPMLLVFITFALIGLLQSLRPETRRILLTGFLAQRSLIILLFIFCLLTLSLLWSAGQRLDTWIFIRLNLRGRHPLWLDWAMWILTQIGNGGVGILLGIFLYFFGDRRLAVEMLLGILSLWLAVELIKAMVERSRPFLTLEGTRIIGWRERGKSFPSGHTSQAFFMMTLLVHHHEPHATIGLLLYFTAGLVGLTRIYVGAHYPRDVVGGAILGSVWGIFTSLIEVYLKTGTF